MVPHGASATPDVRRLCYLFCLWSSFSSSTSRWYIHTDVDRQDVLVVSSSKMLLLVWVPRVSPEIENPWLKPFLIDFSTTEEDSHALRSQICVGISHGGETNRFLCFKGRVDAHRAEGLLEDRLRLLPRWQFMSSVTDWCSGRALALLHVREREREREREGERVRRREREGEREGGDVMRCGYKYKYRKEMMNEGWWAGRLDDGEKWKRKECEWQNECLNTN